MGLEIPEPCPIGQRTQCGLFHLSEVSRKCAPNDLFDQLGGTSQSLLQAHFAHAWGDAISHLRGLSFGLCGQGENRRNVCKTTSVFSGMENQVKRQRKINITNSPPAWGTPSRRGRTKENLTHFFGHYPTTSSVREKEYLCSWLSCFVVKTKINQKAEVQLRTSALFYMERKTFRRTAIIFFAGLSAMLCSLF